jgi:Flp pilus assembly protein TadD
LAVLLVVGVCATVAWWGRQQQQRRDTMRNAQTELDQAALLLQERNLSAASEALARAEARLGTNTDQDLVTRLRQTQVNLATARKLAAARLSCARITDRLVDEHVYETALHDHAHLDVFSGDVEEVARRIAISGLENQLVEALDHWALITPSRARRSRLLDVAGRAGPDAWRHRVRAAVKANDGKALAALARRAGAETRSADELVYLAVALRALGEDPLGPLLQARKAHPRHFWARLELANSLALRRGAPSKKAAELNVVECYRQALALRPDCSVAYHNLGMVLLREGKWEDALIAFGQAVELAPDDPSGLMNLGHVHVQLGDFDKALHCYEQARKYAAFAAQRHVSSTRRLVELDRRLALIVKGEAKPASVEELLALAQFCHRARRCPGRAARFYAEAFAHRPALEQDLRAAHRAHAAQAAVLAGVGQGEGELLSDEERAAWRQRALTWLRADVERCARHAKGPTEAQAVARQWLRFVQADADLSGVREPDRLAKLPREERAEWIALWKEVRDLLAPPDEE